MNADDFENQLRRRTPRTIPVEWRKDILSAAFAESAASSVQEMKHSPALLSRIFGWRALAAAWMVIAVIHFTDHPDSTPKAAAISTIAWGLYWQQERALAAELAEPEQRLPAPVPAATPAARKSSNRTPLKASWAA